MGKTIISFLLFCFISLLAATNLYAAWVENGIPISTATYSQSTPKAVSDGAGGAIITWHDTRNTAPGRGIYIQKVDGWGNVLWTFDGVPIKNGYLIYGDPEITTDGGGGAIVVWNDDRSGDIDLYAQRIDAAGAEQWTAGGIIICDRVTAQQKYKVIPDGEGGAIIAWQDSTLGVTNPSADIFAQKIDANGAPQWTVNGVEVCTNMFEQYEPCIATDEAGGAIMAWEDKRGGPSDIYAQRIDASGNAAWTTDGKIICNAVNTQHYQCIVSDDWGGAIIAWRDYRNSSTTPIVFTQRIDRSGNIIWIPNGVSVSTDAAQMWTPAIVSDGWNGAIITWSQTVVSGMDIFAQRISYLGNPEWGSSGSIVCSYSGVQKNPVIIADGDHGAVIAWRDYRAETPYSDIYAQKLSGDGLKLWNTAGTPVCILGGVTQMSACITSDEIGGAIFAWDDYRSDSSPDVYAQRIERNGYWGYPSPTITSILDVPSDQGSHVTVTWNKSRIENFMTVLVDNYSVWRMLPMTQLEAFLASGEKGADPSMLGGAAAVPAYYISTASGEVRGWELLDYVDATNSETYSDQVETLLDSTGTDPGKHYFMVMAHGPDHFDFWESQPDSGYSVDDIPPAQPSELSGTQSFTPPGLLLSWASVLQALPTAGDDFSHYALYRDIFPDFVPCPDNRIYEGTAVEHFDGDWRYDSGFYYRLSAVDIHGNESGYESLDPDEITDSKTPKVPEKTYITQNVPNPFNPLTTIHFGLATSGRVTLLIYDVSGRLVRSLIDEQRSAGTYSETWDGRNAAGKTASSGVYFYRLRVGTFNETKKMVMTR